MSAIGNLIWLIFGGLISGVIYIIGGLVLCLTIIGIPFGLKAIQYGFFAMAPFGRRVEDLEEQGCLALIFNVIWLVVFGWEIALTHLVFGIILTLTIIGFPFARQHFKLVPMALLPFSHRVVRA